MHFSSLWVEPEYRRRGLARAMFRAVVAEARSNNCVWVTWWVAKSNAEAQGLYRSVSRSVNPLFFLYHSQLIVQMGATNYSERHGYYNDDEWVLDSEAIERLGQSKEESGQGE